MNTTDLTAKPSAYDKAEKCEGCHRALYISILPPYDSYCPYPDCPENKREEPETDDQG
jgi:hypothetical protein